jgi:hypothetical protein
LYIKKTGTQKAEATIDLLFDLRRSQKSDISLTKYRFCLKQLASDFYDLSFPFIQTFAHFTGKTAIFRTLTELIDLNRRLSSIFLPLPPLVGGED